MTGRQYWAERAFSTSLFFPPCSPAQLPYFNIASNLGFPQSGAKLGSIRIHARFTWYFT